MPRFYIPRKIEGNTVPIDGPEQVHHIRRVLRLTVDDSVTVFDAGGSEYAGTIISLEKDRVLVRIVPTGTVKTKNFPLAVACAIPRKSHLDDVIDKLTQMNVDVIIPLETERSVVRLEDDASGRLERWRKIARSAAEQSQRNTLPEIPGIWNLAEVLERSAEYGLKLIPTLAGPARPVREAVHPPLTSGAIVLIGPEGDFTPCEVEQTLAAGFIPVSLGETVLRVETAAIAVTAYLRLTAL